MKTRKYIHPADRLYRKMQQILGKWQCLVCRRGQQTMLCFFHVSNLLWSQKCRNPTMRCFCIGCAKDRPLIIVISPVFLGNEKTLRRLCRGQISKRRILKTGILLVPMFLRWFCIGCAEDRLQMHLPYYGYSPLMTDSKMCLQNP
jgi:hypothetical protein